MTVSLQEWTDRDTARLTVTREIAAGRLAKAATKFCVDCGSRAACWHHEWGYESAYALCVIPLCSKCHGARHGLVRRLANETQRRLREAREGVA